jgi:hypothetical protein
LCSTALMICELSLKPVCKLYIRESLLCQT